ncbi:Glycosyltransferase [hydrothermal vent metagenome]|uniref:Glycosyltransferase n=1 Tax=hydrothermal vent metagenome TaxID=652676 RepID=A0A3B0WCD1_9ZZZZ
MEIVSAIDSPKKNEKARSIAFIGNHLPRQCGIATFTTHLLEAVALNAPEINCWAVAMNDKKQGYDYPSQVQLEINQKEPGEYTQTAARINSSGAEILCLQHEYGIFGGQRGSFILKLLSNLKIPVVTTLHTILENPSDEERYIIMQLAELSGRLVVMSERSVEFLRKIYHLPAEKIALIHHGIPDVPLLPSSNYKDKFNVADKQVLLTFGLISPGKGIETVIDALPEIVKKHPQVIYMVVGATHPHLKAKQGESYRLGLQARAEQLQLADHVIFYDRFISDEELPDFIGAADIYISPYLNEAQIISGTLAYTLGMGKAVVSTPYWHAQELLANGRGKLFAFHDHQQLSLEVNSLLDHPDELRNIQLKAYNYGRKMIWREVGKRYLDIFAKAKKQYLHNNTSQQKPETSNFHQQVLPEIKLDHLRRMTDSAGILQHSKFTVPDRAHGYCVDDNARALIVALQAQNQQAQDDSLNELASVYLSFLDHAFNNETLRFRNFMSYERTWLEQTGSEDSHGRAIWSLGIAVALSENQGHVNLASNLFKQALSAVEFFTSPRAIAFTVIGIHAYLTHNHGDSTVEKICAQLSDKLMNWFNASASKDWSWFEEMLSYDNARLPQALLLSGQWLHDEKMLSTGFRALTWLSEIQTDKNTEHFVAIGNTGWYKKDGEKARFDQQPVEAAAMVDACLIAFDISRDELWITRAYMCFNWYLGENDLHIPLYDHATGGCRDGLQANGVNENQGAESSLSWLMALLAVYQQRNVSKTITPQEGESVEARKA